MYLSDVDIAKALDSHELRIESMDHARYPFQRTQIRYSSVDLRVGNSFWRYKGNIKALDVVENAEGIENFFERLPPLRPGQKIVLRPGEVLFATTLERLTLSNALAARIVPRTTIARFGVSVTCSNDFVNPGQNGTLSLQLVNHNPFPIFIAPYISICQLIRL
jgi:dCTP deaminase